MVHFNDKQVAFDPQNWKEITELIKRHEEFSEPWTGKNEEGETMQISVNKDNITVLTYQHNNWIRENVYHEDGTVEEMYHR